MSGADVIDLEADLLNTAITIGLLVESSAWFVDLMVQRIRDTGRSLDALTVGELVDLIESTACERRAA